MVSLLFFGCVCVIKNNGLEVTEVLEGFRSASAEMSRKVSSISRWVLRCLRGCSFQSVGGVRVFLVVSRQWGCWV